MEDPELVAMTQISAALGDLPEDVKRRVLRWAADRYGVVLQPRDTAGAPPVRDKTDKFESDPADESRGYEHFAELFSKAGPKTDAEKALVAAYWTQVLEGNSQWQSRTLNTQLKDLGHSLPNVTQALTNSINRRPQLIIQLRKSGNSKQANKTYKLTGAGISHVTNMLGSEDI